MCHSTLGLKVIKKKKKKGPRGSPLLSEEGKCQFLIASSKSKDTGFKIDADALAEEQHAGKHGDSLRR